MHYRHKDYEHIYMNILHSHTVRYVKLTETTVCTIFHATVQSKVISKKLIVAQLVNKFPTFHGI
jgi:hypothetical protein